MLDKSLEEVVVMGARKAAGKQLIFPQNMPTNLSNQDFVNLGIDERCLELAFEYKRWYDIKRRK
ncbi:MAG: hypothetical protein RLZZ306_2287 [Bacteroidota bacterium]